MEVFVAFPSAGINTQPQHGDMETELAINNDC